MRSFSLAATSLFAAGALAGNLKNQLVPRELQVRQDQSFTPSTTFGRGSTCADAFGPGFIDCNGVCYNPGDGETCCAGSGDAYPCPSESFCLIDGLCCPDGLPAETCAAQNNVALPQGFSTNTATSAGASTAVQTQRSTISAVESSVASSSAFVPSTTAVVAPTVTPYPVPGNATLPPPSDGTAAPTGTGAPAPFTPFVGAAASVQVYCAGLVVGFAGVVALLL
ncbi:MAG: hypothetical protein LQ345_003566 [Seirophora villosa]|nr:MAG: hypothetical protein LQ345_003566 [Seirophora villosa]